MATTTPNYNLNKPAVGGDDDVWGGLTNNNWDTLDALIKTIEDSILPIGGIIAWSGTIASLPAGFGFCDGTTYTRTDGGGSIVSPDLRSRFTVGATGDGTGNYPNGATGGGIGVGNVPVDVAAHALLESEIPSHDHTGVTTNNNVSSGGQVGAAIGLQGPSPFDTVALQGPTSNAGGGNGHTHLGSTVDLSGVDIDPSWWALAYIMKI